MFRTGQRIQFSIRSSRGEGNTRVTLPGVVVGEPVLGTRPGTTIRQSTVPVVSLRERVDGTKYLRLSDEPEPFLAARGAPMLDGIDVTAETGEVLSVNALRNKAYTDLQEYLGQQPAPVHAAAEEPGQMELLPDAPIA